MCKAVQLVCVYLVALFAVFVGGEVLIVVENKGHIIPFRHYAYITTGYFLYAIPLAFFFHWLTRDRPEAFRRQDQKNELSKEGFSQMIVTEEELPSETAVEDGDGENRNE